MCALKRVHMPCVARLQQVGPSQTGPQLRASRLCSSKLPMKRLPKWGLPATQHQAPQPRIYCNVVVVARLPQTRYLTRWLGHVSPRALGVAHRQEVTWGRHQRRGRTRRR